MALNAQVYCEGSGNGGGFGRARAARDAGGGGGARKGLLALMSDAASLLLEGHPGEDLVGNFVLLAVAARKLNVPFVASGGVATGRQIAAAFALGAEGYERVCLRCSFWSSSRRLNVLLAASIAELASWRPRKHLFTRISRMRLSRQTSGALL